MDEPVPSHANPLLSRWTTEFELPPFGEVAPEHFAPAFAAALAEQRGEIDAIAAGGDPPGFADTIEALERSGSTLRRVGAAFSNLCGAHTSDALQAVEREMAAPLARHYNAIFLNEKLFGRIASLHARGADLGLSPEQARILDRYHTLFIRRGAGLASAARTRLAELSERLATLGTKFGQNVLADEKAYALILEGEADLAGLPDFVRHAAARAAADRGLPGKHAITLARSSIEPFLQYSARRDLREAAFKALIARGEVGDTDNRPLIDEIVALRSERAKLLGYDTFADFRLDDTMAKKPAAVLSLLDGMWRPARARAMEEAAALQEMIRAEGGNFILASWDWRYYAERRRKAEFAVDEASVKPYFQLDRMIEAAFYVATRLFGLSFRERSDMALYQADVRSWEVTDAHGRHLGLFLGDYFARPSKRSGAWMNAFRTQEKLSGDIRPIIVNVMNFSKPAEGAPALLSIDDVRTLFHEFGHALHGLLSDVTYPMIAGTHVSRDFVEFPSQLYEHWFEQPEVLRKFALHWESGEPMAEEMLEKLIAARNFNQGFSTVEYLASAYVDMAFHIGGGEAEATERETLERIGMPDAIVMRHRPTHFGHVFAGDGYSAAYYSYLWSEVLDADGFGAFTEAGDIFDKATADRLKEYVYSAGYLRDPAEAYTLFRGRMPRPEALLRKRGFLEAPAGDA